MPFSSPVCAATSGRCEAIVTDIDGDGDLDILSTSNQEPGITVQRGLGGGQFHETFLDTTCPPHDLVGGDLDGDGVNDLAFFDQTSTFDAVTRQAKGQTTLAIAYGKGYAAPEAAVLSGRFDLATGLAIGKFAGGDDQLLYATRRILCEPLGAGAALVEGQSARLPVAPFYYPAGPMGSDNLLGMELVSATVGRYFPIEKQDSEFGLAVVTRTLKTTSDKEGTTGTEKLWLLAGHANATSVLPLTHAATTVPECTACVLAAVDVDELNTGSQGAESTATAGESATDEMLLLGDGEAIVYQVSKDANGQAAGFEVRASFKPKHSFAFTNPDPLANPKKYVPRPIVKDLDGDRYNDVIVRANDGALVAFWGKADGTFDETELMTPKAKCPEGEVCKGYSAALLNVDRDGASEVFIIGPDTMGLYDVIAASRTLAPIAPGGDASIFHPPPPDSDFTVAAPGDFDGDGVDDVVFLASSSFVTVLRGIPGLQ